MKIVHVHIKWLVNISEIPWNLTLNKNNYNLVDMKWKIYMYVLCDWRELLIGHRLYLSMPNTQHMIARNQWLWVYNVFIFKYFTGTPHCYTCCAPIIFTLRTISARHSGHCLTVSQHCIHVHTCPQFINITSDWNKPKLNYSYCQIFNINFNLHIQLHPFDLQDAVIRPIKWPFPNWGLRAKKGLSASLPIYTRTFFALAPRYVIIN